MEGERERLKELVEEAKLRLSDLTREMDESLGAEQIDAIEAKLELARKRLVELEKTLEMLDAEG